MNRQTLTWVGKWTFILAAAGSAVGLGNIWGFPYKAGTNGGGAFVLIYLACILSIGLPIMISEIMLGKRYRGSPVSTLRAASIESNNSPIWEIIGWGGLIAGIFILSFYSVLAGICLDYIFISLGLKGQIDSLAMFQQVTSSPLQLLFWHSAFIIITAWIIAAGVISGIERMVKLLMPLLFALMILMVINAFINGNFSQAVSYLFSPDFSAVTANTFLSAMGQAFFSLSLGMGAIMCYGAYMSAEQDIYESSSIVAGLDTLIALLAGLAIFPIIFAYGVEPNSGPGLVFISLLSIFADLPFGNIVGGLFFLLLSIAALSSSISLLEPSVAYLSENKIITRPIASILLSGIAWFIGLGSLLSFNLWSDISFIGSRNFLDSMDLIANQFLLPLGGLFVAIYAGWKLNPSIAKSELGGSVFVFNLWRFFIRYVSPVLVFAIFVFQFI
ncbi:MAG: sodium-dependent transporter [Gammaproteobacteria bacterium]